MRVDHILQEATNYEQMFNDVLKAQPNDPKIREAITGNINWAKQTLKKNDRIIWYLRWVKVWMLPERLPGSPQSQALQLYNQRYRTNYTDANLLSVGQIRQNLTHFLGLPIPEIQNYVFQTESPQEIYSIFSRYEQAWRVRMEEENSLIEPEEEDEILLSFPDGYAWWLLPRGSCEAEAKAMGHCGNVPSERDGDRILSLRRKVVRGDAERWYPVATFILDGDGQLGEMKGRGNDKPIEKYHPYIIELLKHDIIEGIKGGGYKPENNFSMYDLDHQTREELADQKPGLRGLDDYYRAEGMTDRVQRMLSNQLSEKSLPGFHSYDAAEKDFIVQIYSDLESFVSANSDEVLESLIALREKIRDAERDAVKVRLTPEAMVAFFDALPDRIFNELASRQGIDPTRPDAEKLLARHLERTQGELFSQIQNAFVEAANHSDIALAVDERIEEYIDAGWSFECSYVWLTLENPKALLASPVQLRISERNLIDLATASSDENDGDYDDAYEADKVRRNGNWDDVDWDNMQEHRRDEGLIKRAGKYGNDYKDVEFPDAKNVEFEPEDLIDRAVDFFTGSRRHTPTINDPRQLQMQLEALRRRAGIAA